MAGAFKSTYTRVIPRGAKPWKLDGKPAVRFTDGRGREITRLLSPSGKRMLCEQPCWWMRYTLPDGTVRRAKGFTDRQATEQEAARRERMAAGAAAGMIVVDDGHLSAPLTSHVDDYIEDLKRTGRAYKHYSLVQTRIKVMKQACNWPTLGAIRPDGMIRFLSKFKAEGAAPKTQNEYLNAAKAFLNWCVRQSRLAGNPLANVAPTDQTLKTYRRRAFTMDELTALLTTAPPTRRVIYLTAVRTGLRRGELRDLRWGDLHIETSDRRPYILLRAESTKARRADTVPLREDLAAELRAIRPLHAAPDDKVFWYGLPKMATFKEDLRRVGVKHIDAGGRVLDFHGLRLTFGTQLQRSGVPLRTAMSLMRHTDAKLTMNIYTDPALLDMAGAVEDLPDLKPKAESSAVRIQTGTDAVPEPIHASKTLSKCRVKPVIFGHSRSQSAPECSHGDTSTIDERGATTPIHDKDLRKNADPQKGPRRNEHMWRRRESNPRPVTFRKGLLRA